MLSEKINILLKEVIASEKPKLSYETVNGCKVPIAILDLRQYSVGEEYLILSPVNGVDSHFFAQPLIQTWPNQFNPEYKEKKWLPGDTFLSFYQNFASNLNGLPGAGMQGVPYFGFLVSAFFKTGNEIKPVAARMLTLDMANPEKVSSHALAVDPTLRRLGLAQLLIDYSVLLFHCFKIGERIEWNTNMNGEQVSGGWSPAPLWSTIGTHFGTMPQYGTADSSVGDGAFYFLNIEEFSKKALLGRWKNWLDQLNAEN